MELIRFHAYAFTCLLSFYRKCKFLDTNIHDVPKYNIYSNKNIKMSFFKSSENIQKKEGGPDRSVSDNQSCSVTLNELAMKARKIL